MPIRPEVISQAELRDRRINQVVVAGIYDSHIEQMKSLAERIRRGAVIEPGQEELDIETLTVRKKKAG